ncbi:DUF6232 family protein [Enterobacter roggenkampii]|nr:MULTISPECIES: DUF6232 family protein [Enterobacter]ELS5729761.1 QacE [Enterobacter roggenkampii]ELT0934753.1 QacE [Enterobacter roggenkampii]ESL80508.1 hypothetical protein L423_02671 [Enterobacter roggenkampii]KDF52472.1 hypothetical protein AF40_04409 [Enterobacter roggenkampii MGH 54]KTH70837.1 QacE [Enterobacter roggenkampii]
MEETEFYRNGNVSITNARFIVGSTTYAMNGVTSVKRGQTDPSKVGPIILVLIGIAMVFIAASLLTKAIGVVIVVVAIAWFKAIKPDYIVYLNSSSGESQALTSQDKQYIDDVINSLNNAIIHRG